MDFGKRLKSLRESREYTQKEFADKAGISVVTVRNWEHNIKRPNMEALMSIARIMRVSLDTLLDFSVDAKPRRTIFLTPEEKLLLKQYHGLDEHGQKIVSSLCSMEYERIKAEQQRQPDSVTELRPQKRDRFIPRYTTAAAAGTSVPLDGANFEMMLVDDAVPPQADYAVDIQGNSMYPYIKDGDMVYVQKDVELEIGDVGIWCVNGAMYCKQYYLDEERNLILVSANPELRDTNVFVPAESDYSVTLYGKVLLGRKVRLPDYLFEEER